MIRLKIKTERLEKWGHIIGEPGDEQPPFKHVLIQPMNDHELVICLLFEADEEGGIRPHLDHFIDHTRDETLETLSPVELIYFFGPHFGDRYGIAEAAVRVIHRESLPILAMGCSVSFIYIVLPEGMALQAKSLLAENFEIP